MSTIFINSFWQAEFSPSDIAGLISWHDANDIATLWQDSARTTPVTADSERVGAWDDKSGGGNHVLQSVAAARPTYKTGIQNLLPVTRYGGSHSLFLNSLGRVQPQTYFVVASYGGNSQFSLDGSPTNNTGSIAALAGPAARLFAGTGITASMSFSAMHLVSAILNGASSSISVDNAMATTGDAGSANPGGIRVGAAGAGTVAHLIGDICEIIIYNSVLSAGNIATVNAYLNGKWGVY